MRRNQRDLLWLGISILAVLTLSTALLGQALPDSEVAAPVINDWSHHQLIFSRPATAEQAKRVERDPRYRQQLRSKLPAALPGVETGAASVSTSQLSSKGSGTGKNPGLGRDWSEYMGNNATMGAGNYPAKFSFDSTTANCATDFVVYSTGLGGAVGQASIVAYNNLYSGCTAPVPGVFWAFNTGGQILTSPVLSATGAQVAFVQTAGGVASLVLLKWKSSSGTLTSPVAPTSVSNSAYPTCTAPCLTTLTLVDSSVAANDSNSSPFYGYDSDIIYVGDNSGYLHKFTPVFYGTSPPSEVTTGGWPENVNASTTPLTNPVYDSVTGNVFVEDIGGFLYLVNSSGSVTQSAQLDFSFDDDSGPGFVQGPIVDSSAGLVYVFATSDGSGAGPNGADLAIVYQLSTSFASGDNGLGAVIGSSSTEPVPPNPMYIGAFDSTYENSADPPTGNLYVCGNTGLNPILYRIPITAGSFGQPTAIGPPTPALDNSACSPVTDVSNPNAAGGTAERLFFSVQDHALPTLCGGIGCALSFVDTPWQPATVYNVGQEVLVQRSNGTIFIDVVTVAGTSGATPPAWPATAGTLTTGAAPTFVNQGSPILAPLPSWTPTTRFTAHARILDGNGNVEIVTAPALGSGISGGSVPNWGTTPGSVITHDGALTWINAGPLPSAALPATGGTSGFIIDNVVGSGTQIGASQVYFSTLGNQACTGGTGGCAVQASQAALK
jgi:hypothetical protein